MTLSTTQEANFWKHVDKSGECWNWTGCKQLQGYGCFRVGARIEYAHRVSFALANGPLSTCALSDDKAEEDAIRSKIKAAIARAEQPA